MDTSPARNGLLPLLAFAFSWRWASWPTDDSSVTLSGRRPPSLAAGAASWVTTLNACFVILALLAASTCWSLVRSHLRLQSWRTHIRCVLLWLPASSALGTDPCAMFRLLPLLSCLTATLINFGIYRLLPWEGESTPFRLQIITTTGDTHSTLSRPNKGRKHEGS